MNIWVSGCEIGLNGTLGMVFLMEKKKFFIGLTNYHVLVVLWQSAQFSTKRSTFDVQ